MEPGGGSCEVFSRSDKLPGRNGIAVVLALLGYYSVVSMWMKLHRVPVRAPASVQSRLYSAIIGVLDLVALRGCKHVRNRA